VAALGTMTGLRVVNLVSNPISAAGKERLGRALGDCRFEW
jgi:hypothetical protein